MSNFLNEKTMEINLCSELTRFFSLLGYHTVWKGYTQQEEDKDGVDVMTKFQNGRAFFIQWKVVKSIDRNGNFKFKIDDSQMKKLAHLPMGKKNFVYYGFPSVYNWRSYKRENLIALPSTRFVSAKQLRNHPSMGKQKSHTGTLNSLLTQMTITSIPKTYEAVSVENIFGIEPISNFKRFFSGYPDNIYGFHQKEVKNPMWSKVQSRIKRDESIRNYIENNFLSSDDLKKEQVRTLLKDVFSSTEVTSHESPFFSGLYCGILIPYLDLI